MGLFNLFGGDKSSSSTTSNNDSRTQSWNDSHDTTTNNTSNSTNTLTQDRRLVVDNGGYGVSADNSTVLTSNSNNSSSVSTNVDSHNVYNTTTDFGAVSSSIAANKDIAGKAIDVSQALITNGRQMMTANIDFLQHISDSSQAEARAAISEVAGATRNALNQVVSIASKPLDAQNPQHNLVIVGMVVFAVMVFSRK